MPREREDSFFDEEDNDLFDEDDLYEKEDAKNGCCICGAYQWSMKKYQFIQVADCICGMV